MTTGYIAINRTLRDIVNSCWEWFDAGRYGDGYAENTVKSYLVRDLRTLDRLWPADLDRTTLDQLKSAIRAADETHLRDALETIIPDVSTVLDAFHEGQPGTEATTVLGYLHPVVAAASYTQFQDGYYREAIFNAIISVFDFLRGRINSGKDGSELVGEAFSLQNPKLIISTLESETGRSEQKGFMQLLIGAYLGIRNPKAHSLNFEPNHLQAAQNLIFASLLARRIDEATIVPPANG